MNCEEFTRALSISTSHSLELRSHARNCKPCCALLALDHQIRSWHSLAPLEMSPELRAFAEEPAGLRFVLWRRALPPIAALFVMCAAAILLAPRPDAASVPPRTALVVAPAFVGIFLWAITLLLARGRTGSGGGAVARYAFTPIALVVYAMTSAFAVATIPDTNTQPRAIQTFLVECVAPHVGLWTRHLPCTFLGLLAGLPMTALLLRAASRIEISTPRAAGAVSGVGAGMAAALVLFLFCPVHAPLHVEGVHAIPLLLCTLVGVLRGVG